MNCRPALLPRAADSRCQKKRSIEATSTVPPLLLATTNHVRSGSIRAAALVIVRSSVVSSTNSSGHPAHTVDRAQHFGAEAAAAHAEQVDRRGRPPRGRRGRAPQAARGAGASSCRCPASRDARRSTSRRRSRARLPHRRRRAARCARRCDRGAVCWRAQRPVRKEASYSSIVTGRTSDRWSEACAPTVCCAPGRKLAGPGDLGPATASNWLRQNGLGAASGFRAAARAVEAAGAQPVYFRK